MSWLYATLHDWASEDGWVLELGSAASGKNPLFTASRPLGAPMDGYALIVETEDGRKFWPSLDAQRAQDAPGSLLKGPVLRVGLAQGGVRTSDGFDWDFLRDQVWPAAQRTGLTWARTPNVRDKVDRANRLKALAPAGGEPKELGYGFGMAQAVKGGGSCFFAVLAKQAPDITLEQLAAAFKSLLQQMDTVQAR